MLRIRGAVAVEEVAFQADDGVALPAHGECRVSGDGRHMAGGEVFCRGKCLHRGMVFGGDDHCHAFLGFADGEFGAAEALIFDGDGVEVDV